MKWESRIPTGWRVRKLKQIADVRTSNVDKKTVAGESPVRLCNYVDVYYNDSIDESIAFMHATASADEIAKFGLREGDVLITKDSEASDDIAVPAHVMTSAPDLVCGYHLAQIRPAPGVLLGSYLARAFAAQGIRDQFRVAATGITRYGLARRWIQNALFPVPPIETQHRIAAFLDRKTAQIDALVAKKERLVELLEEKRAALITHAVTKGLDPTVPMKDSGVEWLGEIPAHWEPRRLGHLARVVRGGSPRPAGDPLLFNGDHTPWITVAELTRDNTKYLRATASCLTEAGARQSRLVPAGTLLLANSGATLGIPKVTLVDGCINDGSVAFFDLSSSLSVDFLYWFLCGMTEKYRQGVKQGSGQPNLNTDIVASTVIALCSLSEQRSIVDTLDGATKQFDHIVGKVRTAITHLHEYRTALISAAVTGQIDVREETS